MKGIILSTLLVLVMFPIVRCENHKADKLSKQTQKNGQIIADHTVVGRFEDIPQFYINEVKKMYVAFYGESHSGAYDNGMELLEAINGTYACNVSSMQGYTDQYLRVEDVGAGIGEDLWFTWYSYPIPRPHDWKITWLKDRILDYKDRRHPLNALGFAWCNDMTGDDNGHSATADPVLGVHWYGRSAGGIDGDSYWGIDADDYAQTGNRISLQTYFGAMEEMIVYCSTNSPKTKMIFTTGPVDDTYGGFSGEAGYQGHLKHEAIRTYVKANPTRILFDYADILCYDNNGTGVTQIWNTHTFPKITTNNTIPTVDAYHISEAGAIRLAKAQWWMLARIAGWDGGVASGSTEVAEVVDTAIISVNGDELRIEITDPSNLPQRISIHNLQGSIVLDKNNPGSRCSFNVVGLSAGIYFVVISGDGISKTQKIFLKS